MLLAVHGPCHSPLQGYVADDVSLCDIPLRVDLAYFQGVLPRKALVTVTTWEWLYREVYPLVPLQIVVAIEALRALVAAKRPLVMDGMWRARAVLMHLHLMLLAVVRGETREADTPHTKLRRGAPEAHRSRNGMEKGSLGIVGRRRRSVCVGQRWHRPQYTR